MADLKLPPRPDPAVGLTVKFQTVVIAAVVVGGLYVGQPWLMPLALAVLISFALSPLAAALRRIRLGHIPAVLITVLFAVVMLGSVALFTGSQLAKLAGELPHYQTNLAAKINSVVGNTIHNGTLTRLRQTAENLADQVAGPRRGEAPEAGPAEDMTPVPVVITRTTLSPLAVAQAL